MSAIVMLTLPFGCTDSPQHEAQLFEMLDSAQSGIGFTNKLKEDGTFNILDYLYFYNGAGIGAGDVNNDGWTDIFFVSNQGKNKLYLNRSGQTKPGEIKFEDVSAYAGIEGFSEWKTGVSMADVNGDGWLDIYVCAVGNFKGLEGSNELYINNGMDKSGKVSFTEQAAAYGLDVSAFSSQAAFFDYDKDGDLDMYLVTHAKHTSRRYDMVSVRDLRENEANDFLFENQLIIAGTSYANKGVTRFKDVSQKAGILQPTMGYGLGIVVTDLNNDQWDDLYVTNDFHEADYYFINNQNGTFSESVANHFNHVSEYSRGCDAADMNNDGFPEVMTVDIYPEGHQIEKMSLGEDAQDLFHYKQDYGYFLQQSHNSLQLNRGGDKFSDIAMMAGVSATDWSWSTLLADYDNDGIKDIFVTNGIIRRPNNLDYIKFASGDTLRYAAETSRHLDRKAMAMMPDGRSRNHLYRGTNGFSFEDKSAAWGFDVPGASNGAAYADIDNDGDLDLIINTLNAPAAIYRNQSDQFFKNHYLKVKLEGEKANRFGVGAKLFVKHRGEMKMQQLMPTRGFLSSVEPILTIGTGMASRLDTVIIVWPSEHVELRTNVETNQMLIVKESEAKKVDGYYKTLFKKRFAWFQSIESTLGIDYKHEENRYLDLYREALMPFQVSAEGPGVAVGDVNGDGLDDLYAGGAKLQVGKLFVQKKNGEFITSNIPQFQYDSTFEDVDATFFDADNDHDLDLYVVSGGNEFFEKMPQLFDRLYLNDGKGGFSKSNALPPMYDNKSCVRPCDFDGDGDIDLFVGGRVVGFQYGKSPHSYLLVNEGVDERGEVRFVDITTSVAPSLKNAGMVTDAVWADFDKDGDMDLTVVGEWMPPRFFENENKKFVERNVGLDSANGFWQTIAAGDFDNDGDVDFIAGNLGTNTKLQNDKKSGLRLHRKDLDTNGTVDLILTYEAGGKNYPFASRDELSLQLPQLQQRFKGYADFAGKPIYEIFTESELAGAQVLEVHIVASVLLENSGTKKFKPIVLPEEIQVSKVFAFHVKDFDGDGNLDILAGGNQNGVSRYQGGYDASHGVLLKGDGKNNFTALDWPHSGLLMQGEVRAIETIKIGTHLRLLVSANNLPFQFFDVLVNRQLQDTIP